jgi:DNA-binding Lrp family transcriptional regulator
MWNKKLEATVLEMRESGRTYEEIAAEIGTSATSVKHKVRRLKQSANEDRYKHTAEKIQQAEKYLSTAGNNILETNSGFGGMTEFYNQIGVVECYDIKKDRVEFIDSLAMQSVTAIHGDSEKELYKLVANKRKYDVIDLDPYGMPSRYFPHVFSLIDKGVLFVTLPMIGVAQMNKITIRHLDAFWGVSLNDKDKYIDLVVKRMKDYAFMHKREIRVLDVQKIDRIYRICLSVEKKSCCDIVGLVVNR